MSRKTTSAAATKPLLFGDKQGDTERAAMSNPFLGDALDPGAVPGYSEKVRANDVAAGRLTASQREAALKAIGAEPGKLPVRLAWVRAAGLDGNVNGNVLVAASEFQRQGYRPATKEDLEAHGYTLPPSAHIAADGTIRREDVALWITDGAHAEQLDRWRKEMLDDFHAIKPSEGADTGTPIEVLEYTRESDFTI